MEIQKVKLIYFSATGTTQTILNHIAEGFAAEDVEHINVTLPEATKNSIQKFSDELVIIGAPVYGGRLPADAIARFKQFRGNKTLAVLVVLYGNREFEDALLELKNLSIGLGFVPVAGGAFIGEHSFSSKETPIAEGRPDKMDLTIAREFGEKIREKIAALKTNDEQGDLKVSGRFPYAAHGVQAIAVAPVTREERCTLCGTCASVCPTAAISIGNLVTTEAQLCIRCCACIKYCPEDARLFEDNTMKNITQWLHQYFSYPKEPRIFGVDM
jgi:ferredoxin